MNRPALTQCFCCLSGGSQVWQHTIHTNTRLKCRSHLRPLPVAMPPTASHPGICKCCCLICLPLLSLCCQTITALAQQALHTILCKQAEPKSCNIS